MNVKKLIATAIDFLFFSIGVIFAQSFLTQPVSYLGKPVPDDFHHVVVNVYDEVYYTYYTNDEIILNTENGIVISSSWTEEYKTNTEADHYFLLYCNSYIKNGWKFFERDLHCNVYKYPGLYVVCSRPRFRTDGIHVIMFTFYTEEYYDALLKQAKGG